MSDTYRYDAFISYRQMEPDRQWAKWLHKALETYRVPQHLVRGRGLPSRLTRVFRDAEELAAGSHLPKEIELALQQSRFLIVVCSPRTPASRWVNLEIERFRELGRGANILALLIEGEPKDSFPKALCEIRTPSADSAGTPLEQIEELEPLAADVRPQSDETDSTRKRLASLRLIAPILGCSFDELRRRDEERRFRTRAALAAVMTGLAITFAVLTGWALQQRSLAISNSVRLRNNLEHQIQLRAESHFEAGEAKEGLASLAAIIRDNPTNQTAVTRLMDALAFQAPPFLKSAPIGISAKGWVSDSPGSFSSDGSRLAIAGTYSVEIWDVIGRKLERSIATTNVMPTIRLSPDGKIVFLADYRAESWLYSADSGKQIAALGPIGGALLGVTFSPDSSQVATIGGDHKLRAWETKTGQSSFSPVPLGRSGQTAANANHEQRYSNSSAVQKGVSSGPIGFSPQGDRIATGSEDGLVQLWNTRTGQPLGEPLSHRQSREDFPILKAVDEAQFARAILAAQQVQKVMFNPQGDQVMTAARLGNVRLWTLTNTPATYRELEPGNGDTMADSQVTTATFSPSGRVVAVGWASGRLDLWSFRNGKWNQVEMRHESAVIHAEFFAEATQMVTLTKRGMVRTWNIYSGTESNWLLRGPIQEDEPSALNLSVDGRVLHVASRKGVLHSWQVDPPPPSLWPALKETLVAGLASDPRGQFLAVGANRVLRGSFDANPNLGAIVLNLPELTPAFTNQTAILGPGGAYRFTPDASRLLLNDTLGFGATLLEVPSGRVLFSISGAPLSIRTAISLGGNLALVASPHLDNDPRGLAKGEPRKLQVVDLRSGMVLSSRDFTNHIQSLAISRDGSRICLGHYPETLEIYPLSAGEIGACIGTLKDAPSGGLLAFLPDGKRIVSGGTLKDDGQAISVWDWQTQRRLVGPIPYLYTPTVDPVINEDGTLLAATTEENRVEIVALAIGKRVSDPLLHSSVVKRLAFSADGTRLATGTATGAVRVWDAGTGLPLCATKLPSLLSGSIGITSLAFTPDGRTLFAGTLAGGIYQWTIFQSSTPAPSWLADLADSIANLHRDQGGVTHPLPPQNYLLAKERALRGMDNGPHAEWVKWVMADLLHRPLVPGGKVGLREHYRMIAEAEEIQVLTGAPLQFPNDAEAWANRILLQIEGDPGEFDEDYFRRLLAKAIKYGQNHPRTLQAKTAVEARIARGGKLAPPSAAKLEQAALGKVEAALQSGRIEEALKANAILLTGNSPPDRALRLQPLILVQMGRYVEAVTAGERWLTRVLHLRAKGEHVREALIEVCLFLSYSQLLARNFDGALSSAETGLKEDGGFLPLETNHAHALLFLGRIAEAEKLYLGHRGKRVPPLNVDAWEEVILADFDALEKAGITHPEFPRLRGLLKAKR